MKERFDFLNYRVQISLPIGRKEKVIVLMVNELYGENMKEFVELMLKVESYRNNSDKQEKKPKTKRIVK